MPFCSLAFALHRGFQVPFQTQGRQRAHTAHAHVVYKVRSSVSGHQPLPVHLFSTEGSRSRRLRICLTVSVHQSMDVAELVVTAIT